MDSLSPLATGIGVAVAALATGYLLRIVRPEARQTADGRVVEYSRVLKVFAVSGWLLVVALCIGTALAKESERNAAIVTTIVGFLSVLYLHLEFFTSPLVTIPKVCT